MDTPLSRGSARLVVRSANPPPRGALVCRPGLERLRRLLAYPGRRVLEQPRVLGVMGVDVVVVVTPWTQDVVDVVLVVLVVVVVVLVVVVVVVVLVVLLVVEVVVLVVVVVVLAEEVEEVVVVVVVVVVGVVVVVVDDGDDDADAFSPLHLPPIHSFRIVWESGRQPRTLRQADLQRRLRMLLQDQEQLAQGREIANVTMTNSIVTSYKQGGAPSVQTSSSRVSP